MKKLSLEEIGITLHVDDDFSREDVIVSTEHDVLQFGVRKAGIRKMEVHAEKQVQLVFGDAGISTVEEIDARDTTANLEIKISAWGAQADATMQRIIYGGKGVNTVHSSGDKAKVIYYGQDEKDIVNAYTGSWEIHPKKGDNEIGGTTLRNVVIDDPKDSIMNGDQTVITGFKPVGYDVFQKNGHDVITFGRGFEGTVKALASADVQKKVNEVVKDQSGGVRPCSEMRDKVMDLGEVRDGDVVQLKCVWPLHTMIAVHNLEKTAVAVTLAYDTPLDLSAKNIMWATSADPAAEATRPNDVAAIEVAGELAQLVGQADQSPSPASGDLLPA
jgi:hypothetical protein